MTNAPNNNESSKKISTIVRWIIGGFFVMFILINGFHYSSIFLICAAFLMLPLPFVERFLKKKNIKSVIAIILSVALFTVGAITSPPSDSSITDIDDTTIIGNNNPGKQDVTTTYNSATTKPSNTTTNNNETTKPEDSTSDAIMDPNGTTSNNEQVQMVWIPSTGTKYHSRSTCSNMNSPRQISLKDAESRGYTACKKCY